jgi:mRNA turnover protein 4
VTLSKTTTKGKEGKENLIQNIRQCLEDFKHLYVFSFHNMRTSELKEVRTKWNTSRFWFPISMLRLEQIFLRKK